MSAEALEVRNRLVAQEKTKDRQFSFVALALMLIGITCLSLLFSGVALFAAFSADQEAAVNSIYMLKLDAKLEASGFDTPPLPGEEQ